MKWTVGSKIGFGFAAVVAIYLVVGAVSYRALEKLTEATDLRGHTHHVIEELSGLLQALTDAETGERGYIITTNESYLETYKSGSAAIDAHVAEIRKLTRDDPTQQQRLDLVESLAKGRMASMAEVMAQLSKGPEATRQAILTSKGKQQMDEVRKMIATMENDEQDLLNKRTADAASNTQNARLVIVAGTAAALVLAAMIGFFITRSISTPLKEITAVAEKVAMGDLSVNVLTNHRADEVGILVRTIARMTDSLRQMAAVAQKIADGDLRVTVKAQSEKDLLGNAFTSMVANLQRLMSQIGEGLSTLTSSANQISTTTTQLASNAAQTATAVTETTTTVEEVRQTAQVASQKAKYVSDNAQTVSKSTQSGKHLIGATIDEIGRIRRQMEFIAEGMMRLSDQNKTIGQIIATVDDLAAQSNILAVNAAIEAAKAGEHGKGFAVVAQEVRSLAEQSKQATSQVRNILGEVQKATNAAVIATEQGAKAVELGVSQSSEAGQSIETLAASVTEAAQAATQIAASGQQQLVGMDQVAAAMESIKQASTQNVSSAKQLEAAAHNLKELGQRLKETVESYKL